MLRFSPRLADDATVLCLGAHCDDVEIGCGGTLVELMRRNPRLRFEWVLFSGRGEREAETRQAAVALMGKHARLNVTVHDFRTSYFPHCASEIKDAFESLRREFNPDLIFTHYLADRHQDHRVLAELTWNTFRNHAVLEYEIPKFDGDLAQPGVFCAVSEDIVDLKIRALMDNYPTQRTHQWFDEDLFRGLMRLRGIECNSPTRFAEAFHARKLVL